ncbi:MAG: FdtA/QdtA family cupin domain-containing protein [Pseudomonadota bacterium]
MKSGLSEVRWIELPAAADDRGTLTAIEGAIDIPFDIRRIFYMHHISADRGGHAHRDTEQVVIGIAGRHEIEVKDGDTSLTFVLDDPNRGLYLPRMTFTNLKAFSEGAVALVLASTHYDRTRSLRTFEDYLAALRED